MWGWRSWGVGAEQDRRGDLTSRVVERVNREGPITFADYQALALYDETAGFFATGRGAGRAGRDFVTSPEVGSLFGALVARAVDETWHDLGEPDPFVVVEAGAGRGRLAADVLRAQPACAPALRYVLVERSAELRRQARDLLAVEPADEVLGPVQRARAGGDERAEPVPGVGPLVTALDDLPALSVDGMVLANELLDDLPVHLVERVPEAWSEVRVACDGDALVECLVPAPPGLASAADELVAGVTVATGARLPILGGAAAWLEQAAAVLHRGRAVIIDYVDSVAGLLARGPGGPNGWLRTYRGHDRGTAPLDAPGSQDVTCDLPREHLHAAATRAGFTIARETSQADWLHALGIDDLVAEGEATWRARAHIGDLEALAGRSRATEAAALTDPSGLGAHEVLVLQRSR
jgi:NADH dehydrogenase [ubiquinone] 1 alpha subcomplex assembly factor 7